MEGTVGRARVKGSGRKETPFFLAERGVGVHPQEGTRNIYIVSSLPSKQLFQALPSNPIQIQRGEL